MSATDIAQIVDRLDTLSQRPENPGVAYRNLDTISALVQTLRKELELNKAKSLQQD